MRLSKLHYKEYFNTEDGIETNPWEIKNLNLSNFNLIVGKNTTGKTRTINVIKNLANYITLIPNLYLKHGEWQLEFEKEDNSVYKYDLYLNKGKVLREIISIDKKVMLQREKGETKIRVRGKMETVSPPGDKLVLHVRRDTKEYPFLEDLILWAQNVNAFTFSNVESSKIEIMDLSKTDQKLSSLNVVPSVFDKLSPNSIKKVIENLNKIGYKIEEATIGILKDVPVNIPLTVKVVSFKEEGLKFPIKQLSISDGMLKTFALLTILQYLIDSHLEKNITILVDNLGEGLDYERSTKLAKLLNETLQINHVQFIGTSNDRFLINAVDIKSWNILERNRTTVTAFNYESNKEAFENFELTGLSNFDFFSSDFLKHQSK